MKLGNAIPIHVPAMPIALPIATATLVNITETAFSAERTYGTYRIEGCKPGQPYTTSVIAARRGIIDKGDRIPGRLQGTEQFAIEAIAIGEDLVRTWNTDIWGIGSTATGEVANEQVRGFAGVFVADSLEPTEEELGIAREILNLSDRALADCAHRDWDQFHRPDMIHAGWKRAMRRLDLDAEFLYTISNIASLPDCPHCGSKLKTMTAKVCATCHRDIIPENASERQHTSQSRTDGRKVQAKHNEAA